MDNSVQRSWEDFLNPDVLRPRLIAASLFIAAFESLRDLIVERIRAFFCHGFNEKGEIVDPAYQADVWIKNVDIPTDPAFDGKDIDEAEIIPGPVLGLQLLCDIALGSEEQSRFYHEEFRKRSDTRASNRAVQWTRFARR